MLDKEKYPEFRNPEKYMKCRVSRSPLGWLKTWSERRALARCLERTSGVRSICDVPCGPGRLFPFWRDKGFRVLAADFSMPMVEAAIEMHRTLGLEGSVTQGDAFRLGETLNETPDLAASVRFAYYFDEDKRIELLRSLAAASRRYVLVQYKTAETLRGKRSLARGLKRHRRKAHMAKRFRTFREIADEIARAGLSPLHFEAVSQLSDRVFVLAEKSSASSTTMTT